MIKFPSDSETERSILAGCIMWPKMRAEIFDAIAAADFFDANHKRIFETMQSMDAKREPVDLITMASKMTEDRVLLAEITEYPAPISVEHSVGKLRGLSAARDMMKIMYSGISELQSVNGGAADAVEDIQSRLLSISAAGDVDQFTTMRDLTTESVKRYEALRDHKLSPGIKTGYPTIDFLTGGFKGSKLIIIAARPSVGKTAFALNLIANMAGKGVPCGFFSVEMDKEEIDDRWFAQTAKINSMKLAHGHGPDPDEWQAIMAAAGRKSNWPVIIDDTGGIKIQELRRRAKKMVSMGSRIIFIDQLSKIEPRSRRKSEYEETTEIIKEISALKKELRIPIVLICQINRQAEQRTDKKPTMADLKATGRIEEEADIVILGFRKFIYTRDEADRTHAEWEIVKHRGGPIRNIEFLWDDKTTRFEERNKWQDSTAR